MARRDIKDSQQSEPCNDPSFLVPIEGRIFVERILKVFHGDNLPYIYDIVYDM